MHRNKILIIGDDIRQHTGVANILQYISISLSTKFSIVQMALGCTSSNIVDMSESISKLTQNPNTDFIIYETQRSGTLESLRIILNNQDPDCILLMSDPHKYEWLFNAEHEIRSRCPILYYHVWDNLPHPKFLKKVYNSCDTISCISKLTYDCVKSVVPEHDSVSLIPHGVDRKLFHEQSETQKKMNRIDLLGKDYEFVLFCNSTNIPRKELCNLVEGFSMFYNSLSSSEKTNVTLLIHTTLKSSIGTDLNKLLDDLYPDIPVLLSGEDVLPNAINSLYNLSHCTINVSSNEGFGLSTLESISTKTPVILNNTGGLSDQYNETWGELIEPSSRILKGTQKVPYIYYDICNANDISNSIKKMYSRYKNIDMTDVDKFLEDNNFTSNLMCEGIYNELKNTLKKFSPRNQYKFTKVS